MLCVPGTDDYVCVVLGKATATGGGGEGGG